jgi:hypothetical protein
MTIAERQPAAAPEHDPEALIKEARARQRRRHRGIAVAVLLAAAAGAGSFVAFGGGSANPPPPPAAGRPPPPAAASPGAIRAFVAEAGDALAGTFTATYQVTGPFRGATRRSEVVAAQRSRIETFYRQTPSFSIYPRIHSYEVFGRRLVNCRQVSASSPWSCQKPVQPGMGTTNDLETPYPPTGLYLGLQNATEEYSFTTQGIGSSKHEPAHLLTRRLAGHTDRCLVYGRISHPAGSVCLARGGLIAYYNLSRKVTFSGYRTAVLLSHSPHVKPGTFTPPAKPTNSN